MKKEGSVVALFFIAVVFFVGASGCAPRRADGPAVIQIPQAASLQDRCLATQLARKGECTSKAGKERAGCLAETEERLKLCELISDEDPGQFASNCTPDPTRSCVGTACTASAPCDMGDVDGDGAKDFCTNGEICSDPGFVCKRGTFWNCECATTFRRVLGSCSCDCQS